MNLKRISEIIGWGVLIQFALALTACAMNIAGVVFLGRGDKWTFDYLTSLSVGVVFLSLLFGFRENQLQRLRNAERVSRALRDVRELMEKMKRGEA